MKIEALKFYKDGFMQEAFALGGSLPSEKIQEDKVYPASLQNYLIDTGDEVILVDTGLPIETPDFKQEPGQKLFMGEKIADFVNALANLGYKPEDVTKVLITHKHPDHTGELRQFPNATIYMSEIEVEAMELKGDNIRGVTFKDGPYKTFAQSEKIMDNLIMVPAYGHTKGNSAYILEEDNLFYFFHGDITYTDEALKRNQLSVVYEDLEAAKDTLDKTRAFIQQNDTIYLSTHTPEGIEALENKVVMKL